MTERILVAYDRSSLGDLAVETALQLARERTGTELHVLAISQAAGDVPLREQLNDDLVAFAHLGRRLGVAVDGTVLVAPDVECIATELTQRRIDRVVIARPAAPAGDTAIDRLMDAAAGAAGVDTVVVRDGASP
jgi:nucleotide-binding universal stress UspA family protein